MTSFNSVAQFARNYSAPGDALDILSNDALRHHHECRLWYLATPYTKYYLGHDKAFEDASFIAGKLIAAGVPIFSPIAHSHPISKYAMMRDDDYTIWLPLDHHFMNAAAGCIVAMMDGWETSHGVREEIQTFIEQGKPVLYMETT